MPRAEQPETRDHKNVVVLAYDGLCTFEFGIAVELFGLHRPEYSDWYRFRVAAVDPIETGSRRGLRATGGVRLDVDGGLRLLDRAGTIVVPGWRTPEPPPPALLRKLQRAHAAGARLLSVCSGVFVLAATGLLDGLRATTHWRYAEALAQRHPAIDVDPDVLYVDEGRLLTSAGSAAGLDLGLHLIRRDFGTARANEVARRLVIPPHREGGQMQFIDRPIDTRSGPERESFARVLDTLGQRINQPLTVAAMAKRAHMSERTFARHFAAATGTTPLRWVNAQRVRRAQELLERTRESLETIATRCGFRDVQTLRLHFKRQVGQPPSTYRRTFCS